MESIRPRDVSVCLTLACAWMTAAAVRAAAPDALVGVFSGASQNAAWFAGGSDPIDAGFDGSSSAKHGRMVWEEELRRFAPRLSVSVGSRVKAGVGFVSHWWTEAGGLTPDGAAVRDDLLARMLANPDADGFVCHVLSSAAYHEAPAERLRAELAGYAGALHAAVSQAFVARAHRFRFWWLEAGNRWGNPEGGQPAAAERRRVPHMLASDLPFLRVAPCTMAYVIGDWNQSGDGIHYTRAGNQRAGRQLALSMLLDWGARPAGIANEPAVVSATRNPEDAHEIVVRVRGNGGDLRADARACRVATADGRGVGCGNQGTLDGGAWRCTVDPGVDAAGHVRVRLRHREPLPKADLVFFHTWGTWHVVTPGRPGYTGPLAVWHETVGSGAGMTQDFADLTALPRPCILTLGAQSVRIDALLSH